MIDLNRLGMLSAASLLALSLGIGGVSRSREPDPPSSRIRRFDTEGTRIPRRSEAKERPARTPTRNSATVIAPPTRWCRLAITGGLSRRSGPLDATTRRMVANYWATPPQDGRLRSVEILVRSARWRPTSKHVRTWQY